MGRTDFSLWYADIQKAAGGKANTLKDQQLSRNDIPIIVDSCIAFITQYGEDTESLHMNVLSALNPVARLNYSQARIYCLSLQVYFRCDNIMY